MRQRREIKVLPVDLNAIVLDKLANMVCEPLASFWIAQKKQTILASLCGQKPLRMLDIKAGARTHAFRLKPDQQIRALFGSMIRDGLKTTRKTLRVRFPTP